ncbi:AAEL001550-PA [Aedes aegypti]|uniref:AAEL001550-PA n=1 Tax=Aedes aegypti TaxID=7159 RepID=Q17KU8_AEDAE|nr:AAEL001550-PA [Aedes aegypti]
MNLNIFLILAFVMLALFECHASAVMKEKRSLLHTIKRSVDQDCDGPGRCDIII